MATGIQKSAMCYGQKFGHNFRAVGAICLNCGVSQSELNGNFQKQKLEYFKKKPEKGIHSEAHALAKEVSEFCNEPKKFGMYLGIIKHIGLPKAYKIFSEMKQGKGIETPGKLFLYMSANNPGRIKKQVTTSPKSIKSRQKKEDEPQMTKQEKKKPLRQGGANKTDKNRLPKFKKKVSGRKK